MKRAIFGIIAAGIGIAGLVGSSVNAAVPSGCGVAAGGDGCKGYVLVVPSPTAGFTADPPATVIILRTNKAWCNLHGGTYAGDGVCMDIDY